MKRYGNIDGLRTIAALGVVLMHVRANIGYKIVSGGGTDYLINRLIPQLSSYVYLFFIISGFAMCCGYYEKIKNNEITLNNFYSKRYRKVLPFFSLLVLMDLAVKLILEGGIANCDIYEAFADLTLMFGLLPASNITVVGVGWTLGVIFGFYILFPFFVFLIWTRKRAWVGLILSIGLNYLCTTYFLSEGNTVRCNVLRCLCYFIAGGLIYLYRAEIENSLKKPWMGLAVSLLGFVLVLFVPISSTETIGLIVYELKTIAGFSLVLCGAICPDIPIWKNRFTAFISKYSLEVYLAHMMVFRVLEKIRLTQVAGSTVLSMLISFVLTVSGAVLFAILFNLLENNLSRLVSKSRSI